MSILLTQPELAYLLATLHAKSAPGLTVPGLFPAEPAARDAQNAIGYAQLQEHGFLQANPAQPGAPSLDPFALRLVSVLADPQLVCYSRADNGTERRTVLHYLADDDIVEVSTESDNTFRLGVVPTLLQMSQRLILLVSASLQNAPRPAAISDEPLAQFILGKPVNGVIETGRVIQLRAMRGIHTLIWKEAPDAKASSLPMSDVNLTKVITSISEGMMANDSIKN